MPGAKDIRFVAMDPTRGGLPVKRKQTSHACASCRRKKRRCHHILEDGHAQDADEDAQASYEQSPSAALLDGPSPSTPQARTPHPNGSRLNSMSRPSDHQHPAEQGDSDGPSRELRPRSSRFVGDLNPEGMFLEATGATSLRGTSHKADVGIWYSSSMQQPTQFITARPPPMMDRFLLPFVKEHCITALVPDEDFAKLKAVYVQKVHPLFPIIPLAALDDDADVTAPTTIVLRQLVCLASGTDTECAPHLRLKNNGAAVMTPQDFSQALSSAVRTILDTSLITDRVLHIRALVMLSLYTQPTCTEEADLPAQLGSRAVHHLQTLGLHILQYQSHPSDELETILCTVWAMDRINAATYGRPCLMHDRDIGSNLSACIRRRPPAFRLFLSVIQWLDHVVELYRPGPSAEASGLEKVVYIDLPVLEGMIVEANALQVPAPLIATIEAFYHAIIILSCRLPRPGTAPAASTLPPPSANARRSLAAERITSAVPRDQLSPVPLVPYAVSLALSVEYRKMRHSRLPMFRARAMSAFRRNCEMLRGFGDFFWTANVMAGLGERVLREMERAANTLNRDLTPLPAVIEGRATVDAEKGQGSAGSASGVSDAILPDANIAGPVDANVDFSMFDQAAGEDIFGHIDPSFDLSAVEDVLEANLDIGLPPNWGDWSQYVT